MAVGFSAPIKPQQSRCDSDECHKEQRLQSRRHCEPNMAPITFEFNVAFTLPVNTEGTKTKLVPWELWQGIKRGGRNPNDFADYVASCEVLSGGRNRFRRRLTLADGAVHTAKGAHLDQDVLISKDLHVSKILRLPY